LHKPCAAEKHQKANIIMKIASISEMKADAANLHDKLGLDAMIVTQNGQPSLVVQKHQAYEFQQERMAFMELVINSQEDARARGLLPVDDFLESLNE
jgi:PHD/YefM family antitoxin component YafN of YafNO toxin-antitoxin module